MLCQACGKEQASYHYVANDNGNVTEKHLCHKCAEKAGLIAKNEAFFQNFGFGDDFFAESDKLLGGLLGSMVGLPEKSGKTTLRESTVCPFCGSRISDFMRSGKAGCAKCYATFRDALAPTVKKIHGTVKHTGKLPFGRHREQTKEEKKAELQKLLDRAVAEQAYEKAAEYRDKIKALDENTDEAKGA